MLCQKRIDSSSFKVYVGPDRSQQIFKSPNLYFPNNTFDKGIQKTAKDG